MFDFGLTERPCFLYVPDLESYIQSDRRLYFDINELPFISAKSNEELSNEIVNFDGDKYKKNLDKFSREIGSFESGKCCEELEKRLEKICCI